MSHWSVKSASNFTATNKLNIDAFFASSVHCSYYSCIQFMFHILSVHFNKTDRQINDESYNGGKQAGGLHNWLFNTISNEIAGSVDANSFDTYITDLQDLRVKSDYKNQVIIEAQANEARNIASKTLVILKRNFKI